MKVFYNNVLADVVSLVSEKKAQAVIKYNLDGVNYNKTVLRSEIKIATVIHSEVKFYFYRAGLEYCIEARADFFKSEMEEYVSEKTAYEITELKVNNFIMDSIAQAVIFTRADEHELIKEIKAKLLEYADELPF